MPRSPQNRSSRRPFRALDTLEPRTLLSAAAPIPFVGPIAGDPNGVAAIHLPDSQPIAPLALLAQSWASLIGLDQLRDDARFTGIDGEGFTSVIIDGGADLDHPFFGPDLDADGVADRILYQYDFANLDASAQAAADHGSNVASIVGSQDSVHMGVAPGASLIILKVFSDAGTGNFAYVEDALRWVVQHAADYSISSVNLSLGDNQNHDAHTQRYRLGDELEELAALNVKVAASAGNSFYTFNSQPGAAYPASDPSVIGVGAVFAEMGGSYRASSGATAYSTSPDQIAPFSQRESALTPIFAPGVAITGANRNGGTVTMSGTSQASPIIAGLALLADQIATVALGRVLTTSEFRSILTTTGIEVTDGDDENDNVDNTNQRFRRVDALAMGEAILAMGDVGAPNRAPTLTTVAPLAHAIPGRPYVISYDRLFAAANAGDADGDVLTFRVEAVISGSLLKNGAPVSPGFTTLGPGEHLIWKPSTVRAGSTEAFAIVVNDGLLDSAGGVAVSVVAGPTVFGITSRVERESRSNPSPVAASSPFERGHVARIAPAAPIRSGWATLLAPRADALAIWLL